MPWQVALDSRWDGCATGQITMGGKKIPAFFITITAGSFSLLEKC
jgi:hypothetical protein